ncbi:DUF58 domain-containing protein [Brevibacterium sp. NPDC049920]|uniref:DUF58 domain-containing protein n=1 Tax=Brevibacterium pityocampae TaxID=506594 RepID=A0ABP8JRJ7_9MICO|nr:DUF58 domain-containing protein [uncultured Brevibacterium sp.]
MVPTWRFVLLVALAAIPVLLVPGWDTAGLALAAAAFIALLDWLLTPRPRRVSAQRTPGRRVRLGEDTHATLTLRNEGRRMQRLHVRDAWTPSAGAADVRFRTRLRAGESFERVLTLTPTRRGVLPADRLTLRSRSWLGVLGRQTSIDVPASIRVMPPFLSRRHLPSKLARLRELDGRTAVMIRGLGTEFDSLREYVRGDDVRSIDWRATARARELMVRTWRPERDRRVVIVLDSSRLAARRCGTGTVFDAALEAGQLLAALAAGGGDRVDLLVADARVRARIGPITGRDPMGRLSNELTDVDPELLDADWDAITSAVMRAASQHSLVVLVTALDPTTVAEDILPALPVLRARHSVAIASVADPELESMAARVHTPALAYRAAAAERELLEVRSVIGSLRESGIHSVHEPPEDLAPALADLYISLKATGRL